MPQIDPRLLDMTDPVAAENFNRTLKASGAAIKTVILNADTTGKITGGKITLADKSTIAITVQTAT